MKSNVAAKFTSPVAVACYVMLLAVAAGALLGVFAVVPALKNKCIWFTGNCQSLTYQIAPNGTLLVINPATQFMYWYDGQFIYSYGNAVQGVCTNKASTGTHKAVPVQGVSPVTNACLKYGLTTAGESVCVLPSNQTIVPTVFDGKTVGQGQAFEPVFVVNAYSMQVIPQKTSCALSRSVVQSFFKNVPTQTLTYNIPPTGSGLDIYQLFGLLQERGVFQPPATDTIWYNQEASTTTTAAAAS